MIEYGYCHCGCGEKTTISKQTYNRTGAKGGEPNRYLPQHHTKPKSTEELYLAKVIKRDGCWGWTGHKSQQGYARFKANKKMWIASRVAYELYVGPIPEGLYVCHKCDNPECSNPDHLFVGTHKDNMDDMRAKGRDNYPKGERMGMAKLTEDMVREIRAKYIYRKTPMRFMCKEYNINTTTFWKVIHNEIWTHVI